MSMFDAIRDGRVEDVRRLLDAGEDVNGVDPGGTNHVMVALHNGQLAVVRLLHSRGAVLSRVYFRGRNALHGAAIGGSVDCIEWVLDNTTIDVNSTDNDGTTPIMVTIHDDLMASNLLVERGANLFLRNNEGTRSIHHPLGPHVLQHALDLRWSSVKQLLFISNFHENSDLAASSSSSSFIIPQPRSSHLAVSVFAITGLVRHIAEYLIRTELIVRDPATKKKDKEDQEPDDDQEPDEVKRRVEATLAAHEESNKRSRK
jgi:ankyrin repeat protein